MKRFRIISFLAGAALVLAQYGTCQAVSVGVSFAGDNGGGTSIQISPGQTAGVIPQANWNAANTLSGSLGSLVDDSGAATSATVTWGGPNNTWGGTGATTGDEAMVNGWLDDNGPGSTTTVTGIPYDTYDVYVYGSSDAGNAGRGWAVTVNGTQYGSNGGVWEDPVSANGSYFDGFTYVDTATGANNPTYTVATGLSGDLTINGIRATVDGLDSRGSVSGFQIVTGGPDVFDRALRLIIDRGSGQIDLTNNTNEQVDFAGVGMLSDAGAFNPANWKSVTDNYDGDSDGSVSSDPWLILASSANDLSEATLGTGSMAHEQTVDSGAAWLRSPYEDVTLEYLDPVTGVVISGLVQFTGDALEFGDFNADGAINALDWPTIRDGFNADLSQLGLVEAYLAGDMDGDLDNDLDDLLAFKDVFELQNGAGSFADLLNIPEPSTLGLLVVGVLLAVSKRRWFNFLKCAAPAFLVLAVAATTHATGVSVNFLGGRTDNDPAAMGPAVTGTAGVVPQANWNNVGGNNPATDHNATVSSLLDDSGAATSTSVTWSTAETWTATGNFTAGSGNQDRDMMDGYIDAVGAQPTVTADFANLPYDFFDVYVYVGSDGDGRTGHVSLNGQAVSDRWFVTSTATDTFTTAADYTQATALTEATAVASNYVLYEDVAGPAVTVGVTRGSDNTGMHGVQIVEELNPQLLKLEVNTLSGQTSILDHLGLSTFIDYFEITSESSSLNEADWNPLGSGTNDGSDWEALGNLDDSILAQFYLQGNDTPGTGLSLGSAFSVGGTEDLVFQYNDVNGYLRQGIVEYVMTGGIGADFNNDGIVDGDDFLIWQSGFGNPGAHGDGDANLDNIVDGDDFLIWQAQFGGPPSGGAAGAAVPEPSTLGLLGLMFIGMALRWSSRFSVPGDGVGWFSRLKPELQHRASIRRNHGERMMKRFLFPAIIVTLSIATAAMASSTNDRVYFLGDADGVNPNDNVNTSVDSEVPQAGTQQDLATGFGSQTYVDVGPGGLDRPGAESGDLGIRFNASDGDYMWGDRLGDPSTTASSTGGFGPLDYSDISNRGFQLWINPSIGASSEAQHIVMDTFQHGVGITASGNWFMQYNNDNNAVVDTGIGVTTDQWYHVMVVRPFGPTGTNSGAQMYVDGIAVATRAGGYNGGDVDTALTVGANTGDFFDSVPGESNHFDGVIDDLEMFVMGVSTDTAQDWGTFQLAEDNPIVGAVWGGIPDGDIDRDSDVDDDDVALFITNWRTENPVAGGLAGDLNTRGLGDFNYDGVVNFTDWWILRANHPNPAGLNLGDLLGSVPEPASAVLAILAIVTLFGSRRRR